MSPEEVCWRRAVDSHTFVERALDLLVELGSNLEIVIRISPATQYLSTSGERVHPAQQRIDNYFRDEILNSKGNLRLFEVVDIFKDWVIVKPVRPIMDSFRDFGTYRAVPNKLKEGGIPYVI